MYTSGLIDIKSLGIIECLDWCAAVRLTDSIKSDELEPSYTSWHSIDSHSESLAKTTGDRPFTIRFRNFRYRLGVVLPTRVIAVLEIIDTKDIVEPILLFFGIIGLQQLAAGRLTSSRPGQSIIMFYGHLAPTVAYPSVRGCTQVSESLLRRVEGS